jgi:signal transduction histidine kinase
MESAGIPTRVVVSGRLRALPAEVDAAAFRIVQEALANVLRHAGPAFAQVEIVYRPEHLLLQVVDDGRGVPEEQLDNGRARHGLAGMRERAEALGGGVEAGRRPGGGFCVRASLPLAGRP